jgi:hypothetical protein
VARSAAAIVLSIKPGGSAREIDIAGGTGVLNELCHAACAI